jgi:hypothetical protein
VDAPEAQARAGIEAQLEKLRAAFQTGGDKNDRDAFGFGS